MNQLCSAKGSIILQSGRKLIRECCCWQIITLGWKYLNDSRPRMVPTWLHCEALKYDPSSFPIGRLELECFCATKESINFVEEIKPSCTSTSIVIRWEPASCLSLLWTNKTNIALNFGNYALQVSCFIDWDRDYTLEAALREFNFETAEGEMGDIWILRNVNKTPNFWHRI